jgi:hypothetical protein
LITIIVATFLYSDFIPFSSLFSPSKVMFKRNVGTVDRVLRVVAGLGLIAYGVYAQSWIGAIGLVPLATAAMGSCPLYSLVGLSTCQVKQAS